VELAQAARPFACFINPDDPGFTNPQDMPKAICEYCARTGQNALLLIFHNNSVG
jgi:rhamnulokinase